MKSPFSALATFAALASVATTTAFGAVSVRVVPEKDILPADTSHRTILQILIETEAMLPEADRPPLNLSLVIDRSGSMQGDRIVHAREAALAVIDRLGSNDILSLVTYDSTVETVFPAGPVRNKAALAAMVRRIQPRGMTALYGGVTQGAAELRKHADGNYVHRMILISDGVANVGPSSPQDLARLGGALNKEGISVSTLGLGLDYNEDLMTQLASRSDGNSYFVEASPDLPRILDAELGQALTVIARQAVLELELPSGVRPIRIVGRDGTIRDNRVEVSFNQLYGDQQRYVLVEVEVDGGKPEERRDIGRAQLRYRTLNSDTEYSTLPASAEVAFSRDTRAVEDSLNVTVQREYLLNEAAVLKDQAIDLAAEGRREEAASLLRSFAQSVAAAPSASSDARLISEMESLEADSELIEEHGLDNRSRKTMRAESYQLRTQQGTR